MAVRTAVREDLLWTLVIDLEIMLFNTPWWALRRRLWLHKLIRTTRKGLTK